MTEELKKAIEEAKTYHYILRIDTIDDTNKVRHIIDNYEHALTLAVAEIEEKDNRIKELGLQLDAYSTHNIDRTFEKDKLVNRIASLEEAMRKALDDGCKSCGNPKCPFPGTTESTGCTAWQPKK